jgi:lipid II:glycine glycyltransferase (peptidoglycan interpeptide bridge formation enzyme)
MQAFTGAGSAWNALIARLPDAHFLQTWEWAQVKAAHGWKPMPFVWQANERVQAAALVLKRQVISRGFAARLCVLYCPKGPLLNWPDAALRDQVLNDLQSLARKQGAIFLKLDPDVVLGTGVPGSEAASEEKDGRTVLDELKRRDWMFSTDQIQFRNTVLMDLAPSEDELLGRMKQKSRYNVRLAEKKGVTVRAGTKDDLPLLYRMYAETSLRDGFVIRDEAYYRTVWETFMSAVEPSCEPLIAEAEGGPVAAIFLFYFAGRAYYVYGMSGEVHREKMPNYLLQWEAMKRAKARGCRVYDLWGAPDEFNEDDSLWGVFRFKEGLGGQVVRTLGAWDYAPNPFWYKTYAEIIPRLLDVMRSRGRQKTRQSIGGA